MEPITQVLDRSDYTPHPFIVQCIPKVVVNILEIEINLKVICIKNINMIRIYWENMKFMQFHIYMIQILFDGLKE
jgi:hypothetical protein